MSMVNKNLNEIVSSLNVWRKMIYAAHRRKAYLRLFLCNPSFKSSYMMSMFASIFTPVKGSLVWPDTTPTNVACCPFLSPSCSRDDPLTRSSMWVTDMIQLGHSDVLAVSTATHHGLGGAYPTRYWTSSNGLVPALYRALWKRHSGGKYEPFK